MTDLMNVEPIFIVGCARSGTTLLRTMLNNHPAVAIPVESLFMIDYLRAANNRPIERFQKLVLQESEFQEWQIDITLQDLVPQRTVANLLTYLHEQYAHKNGKHIWGQKTPRFIRYGDLLKNTYPAARFIHLIRDPRAVAASLTRSNVHHSNTYFGAQRWLRDVQAGYDLKQRYPNSVLEIKYEDLVKTPRTALRVVCDFLGLIYDDAMLTYHETSGQDYGKYHASIHQNLNRPPQPDRIEAWRQHLTAQDIALVEEICGDLMQTMGYQPDKNGEIVSEDYIHQLKRKRLTVGLIRQVRQYFNGRTWHLFYMLWRKYRLGLLVDDLRQVNY